MRWVFIHGAGGSSDFWEFQRPHFPDALFLDLPGHSPRRPGPGATAQPAGQPLQSIPAYAGWVRCQVEQLNPESVMLVGHSMGGAIALTVALSQPGWLAGLVLSATGARLQVDPELLRLLGEDYPAAVDWIISHSFAADAHPYRLEGARRQLLRTPREVLAADYLAAAQFDLAGHVPTGEMRVPVVIVYGDRDQITPAEEDEALRQALPRSAAGLVEGAGHMAPLERPGEWASKVKELWAGIAP